MSETGATKRSKRIPRFRSLEEEAEFWDTHDSTQFEDQWRPARIRIAEKLEHVLLVSLEARTIDRLAKIAREQGVDLTKLAGEWIEERVNAMEQERKKP